MIYDAMLCAWQEPVFIAYIEGLHVLQRSNVLLRRLLILMSNGARKDFAYFCDVVGDKPPAEHHKEWHKYLCTGEDSECLIGIGGPNIDILAPRGSAKSTILGLYTAWAVGVHALARKPLKILYISYTVDVARPKRCSHQKDHRGE